MNEKLELALDHLLEASKHLHGVTEALEDMYKITNDVEDKPDNKKVKIEIRVKKPIKETADLNDEEIDKIRQDLEEIIKEAIGGEE